MKKGNKNIVVFGGLHWMGLIQPAMHVLKDLTPDSIRKVSASIKASLSQAYKHI